MRVLRAALEAMACMLAMATLVFLALRLLPGDPAQLLLGDEASVAELAALRARLGLDLPLHVQYAHFLRGLVTLDLGTSLRHPSVSAMTLVGRALPSTSALAAVSVGLAAIVGTGFAVLAAGPFLGVRRAWVERTATAVASTPLLSFAPVVTYFLAVRLRAAPLPGDPDAGVRGLLFASGLLALPLAAHITRVGRAALEDATRAQYLVAARARGAGLARTWLLHAVPPSLGPILAVVASQLGALLGGAVILERLFERPGLGTLIVEAYATRDMPVLEAAVIAAGGLFVLVQVVATALHAAIDPRVRHPT
jgi:ABC-type dipeptide/oligopeptide/nickel transport system permease component